MPAGVVNFCPGSGASFRRRAWSRIPRRATSPSPARAKSAWTSTRPRPTQAPGQIWIKRTILEMGGKDAIIVDADADLDAAVEGVAAAAFGFQGQKCSACSRAIVDERIYDKFLEQLKARVEKITIGDPAENAEHGPGDQRRLDEDRFSSYIEHRQEGRPPDHRRRARSPATATSSSPP